VVAGAQSKSEGIVDRFGINNVVVVKHEDEIVGDCSDLMSRVVRIDSVGGG